MDLAILRGAISMGEEYCSQDDEVSEFGWILWSSFLVFCKFVYLRPVFHLHQLGVFHSSRADAAKSALIELGSMICHICMLAALLWRALEPGFSAFRTASCSAHGRAIVADVSICARAADWYALPTKTPLRGENRTRPLSMQPPGCYYSHSEEQLVFNPIICTESEQWCPDWIARTYGTCSKDLTCLCECSFLSLAVLASVVIFSLPIPLQWRMLQSSVAKVVDRPRAEAPGILHTPSQAPSEHENAEMENESATEGSPRDTGGGGGFALRGEGRGGRELAGTEMVDLRQRATRTGSRHAYGEMSHARGGGEGEGEVGGAASGVDRLSVLKSEYARALKGLEVADFEGLHRQSVYADAEAGLVDSAGAARKRIVRLQKELASLEPQLEQLLDSSIWVRYDTDRPQFMRAAITGPSGTPYSSGVFFFEFFFPLDYPQVPPKVTFLTTGNGSVRFNPNLYADGKVCLSLLGTYEGPRWSPGGSIYQVLVSIQGMILGVTHPIYNEPGLGGFETHERG